MSVSNKQEGMIFKATYSGVPVYECIIKGTAVMRRRSDSWINATHILKVVGLDKPQRTRVLERDVQKGVHEKVQGGYGKYQGTWIPLEDAIALAKSYNVSHLFDPITGYVPTAESPPPAPKHVMNNAARVKKPAAALALEGARGRRATSMDTESELAVGVARAEGTEGTMSPSPSDVSSSSRTPSPIAATSKQNEYYNERGPNGASGGRTARGGVYGYDAQETASRYTEIILDYFISESTTIPPLLVSPPADFDPNMSIDDDEHTALHWACAMGRIRVVKLLLTAGADVFRVNQAGQTALMRAAMFSNNYDLRKFPELFELLHRSILNIDRNDRTVFHHVVDLALGRGKPQAARYYLETMINRLSEYGSQLADILNFQDDEGETPLTLAARARSKRLTRLLLEHGADPKIRNKEGKNAEDYIVEDERFRASPARGGAAGDATGLPVSSLHTSEAGQRAGGRAVALMNTLLHSLADSFDSELATADRRLTQAHSLLSQIQGEIAESAKVYESLNAEGASGDSEKRKQGSMQTALKASLEKRGREDMERDWAKTEPALKRHKRGETSAQARANGADSSAALSDFDALTAPAPSGQDVKAALATLRQQVADLKKQRSQLMDRFVAKAKEQGTGSTMAAYRRLIATGCGGIAPEEVDAVVSALCELLEEGNGAVTQGEAGPGASATAAATLLRNASAA